MKRDPLPSASWTPAAIEAGSDRRYAPIAITVLAICGIVAVHWATATSMATVWLRSETFTHGILVAPISGWLIWRMRHRLDAIAFAPSWWAAAAALVPALAWLAGELLQANALRQFALVALIILAVPAVLGGTFARRITFPLGFLLFAVPFGEFLLPQLMDGTARFAVFALRLSGIPVYQEGLQFVIPSGAWSVVEACSGVRYLIASTMIGTLYAYLTYRSPRRRLAFVAVAIVVPIVANWVRAYLIVLIGHLSSNRLAVGVDHLIYGWLFFGLVMLLMFWIGSRWREPEESSIPTPTESTLAGGTRPQPAVGTFATAAAVVVLIALAPVLAAKAIDRGASSRPVHIAATTPDGHWQRTNVSTTDWRPIFVGASGELAQTFMGPGGSVALHVAFYRNQSSEQKLLSSSNRLVASEDQRWSVVSSARREHSLAGGELGVQASDLRRLTGERLRVWRWFWVDGRFTADETTARAWIARQQLSGRGDDAAAITISTSEATLQAADAADAVLGAFARDALPSLQAALRAARDER